MPPHPTLFLRRSVFEKYGYYDTNYSISSDYDAILKWFSNDNFKVYYLPEVLIKMRTGGRSNKLINLFKKSKEDLKALRKNRIGGFYSLFLKNVRKISQFF